MNTKVQKLGIIVILFAVLSLAMGAVFIQQGFAKEAFLTEAMTQEQITLDGVEGTTYSAETRSFLQMEQVLLYALYT
ncbi:unnamed protein product [marine sediment metagenome]|uniref:Uncharacterized protein n=1 Tax=marine sediment metagenome TaxID=412755 RepID=X0VC44_9ZZZZ